MSLPRALLVGAHGHGRGHLERLRRFADEGRLELAGVCDTSAPDAELTALAGGAPWTDDLGEALRRARPDVAVVVTPIPTHAPIALAALAAGADLLLEKPPTATLAEFHQLQAAATAAGRNVQVGFQSLASDALPSIAADVAAGRIGALRGIGVAGTWQRAEGYWNRAAWAGRRTLGGRPVVDGALTNPFAHAVATALRLDGSEDADALASVELELHRANPIEADDTSCLRLRTARGTTVVVAVTLCASETREPTVTLHGDRGSATLRYTRDEVTWSTDRGVAVEQHGRRDLLADLLAHRADPASPLLVPLAATAAFTTVVEAVRTAPDPRPVAPGLVDVVAEGGERRCVVRGVDELVAAAAHELALFSELDPRWALPAQSAGAPAQASVEVSTGPPEASEAPMASPSS
ncbi:Gfo/Idh/MocA family protein [Kineococcus rubinsiae]|uniref:Gfo/Idh/MocA family protein n=1 Tax=Kineococcus rubinsiae TaxID=2609562 RepID=UPI001430EC9C|nr:Gfo/Idh/MocA family oxidoreductase [Kineococcus rubinsiae]NIZ93775.1 Gfo/Idh/MocA family oxidoreductase [Kineococcus rubinsiae]